MTMTSRLYAVPFLLFTALCGVPALAQTVAPGGFNYKAGRVVYRANGVRLEGSAAQPARIQSPEIDVQAPTIAFDLQGNSIQEVRAIGGVNLKLNLSSKNGGQPAHIEATCTSATLTPGDRKLVLTGNLNGFYQVAGGPKNTLKGEQATLSYPNKNLSVDLQGGAGGVVVTIPPEGGDKPDAIGTVTISARKATFDGTTGVGHFTGNARAYSTDGPNKFDVAAPEFLLTRGTSGTISELTTVGRTTVKVDLPPQPAATGATGAAAQMGAPTHVEAVADAAVVNRDSSTLVFKGNVKGFYRLKPADGTAKDYNFAGDTATFKYSPTAKGDMAAGMNVEVVGKPVTIEAPAFELGL
jgi:lipopolysaccharide export system protein LptA